ncbi:hypothetical protein ACFPK1_32205 [Actinomycetospora rhizophila]|uniref:Alpha-L-rhamnosidase six-hairpin glycosidase domain-containing protein n=1 Tax=Actinomycetospora rhizophila TaxID=1416876 RepID=A0ABV9ZR20_9PSEU
MARHEELFYEVMWRAWTSGATYPIPWWALQALRAWSDDFDQGLFESKQAAFAANALYRYWNMIGVKDAGLESLVGQAGEIAPVYEAYAVSGFLFEPDGRRLHLPQTPRPGQLLRQRMEDDHLPVVETSYQVGTATLQQKALATTVGPSQRSMVLHRLRVTAEGGSARGWLCLSLLPWGPSSFQRRDRAGRYELDRQLTFVRYLPAEARVEVNSGWGPVFDTAPTHVGLYGNPLSLADPELYLQDNPWVELGTTGALNGVHTVRDGVARMCTAAFAWPYDLAEGKTLAVDVRLPVDDYRGGADLVALRSPTADELEAANRAFWTGKLNGSGLRLSLPAHVTHLVDLYRLSRATVLILADHGVIHPGPTIYDSFWVRDSSIEGIASALAGDSALAETQFSRHYPTVFNQGPDRIDAVSLHGFFGGKHEKDDREWDSNGQALWAFGRLDRILGPHSHFGARMFTPYVVEGARWIRDNRSEFGLLHSGWSAEHLGEKDKPHYWDDFWGVAGLYEAARLADRLGASEAGELWGAYDDLRHDLEASIRWVLDRQREAGRWETFIPTGPADVNRRDSTIVGTIAYFHPCRLYQSRKLGDAVDAAAHDTLDTIWAHFVDGGGLRHDSAWRAYGPYLGLQLAHAFLLIGDQQRMDACLRWAVGEAAYAAGPPLAGSDSVQIVSGAWNEQHAYSVASDFTHVPSSWWYMGDIPHGWAAAEFQLLMRDICFFESGEDESPHVYLAPGVLPHWLTGDTKLQVQDAPTVFGELFGFTLTHDAAAREVTIDITQPMRAPITYIYPLRLGKLRRLAVDGIETQLALETTDLPIPAGTEQAVIAYH